MLRLLRDNLNVVVWALDARGTFTYHEGKGIEAAGMQPGQLVGRNYYEIYDYESALTTLRQVLDGRSSTRSRTGTAPSGRTGTSPRATRAGR